MLATDAQVIDLINVGIAAADADPESTWLSRREDAAAKEALLGKIPTARAVLAQWLADQGWSVTDRNNKPIQFVPPVTQ